MAQSHVVALALLSKVWPAGEWSLSTWQDGSERKWLLTHPAMPDESVIVYTMSLPGCRDHCEFVCRDVGVIEGSPQDWLGTEKAISINSTYWRTHSSKGRIARLTDFLKRTLGVPDPDDARKGLFHAAHESVIHQRICAANGIAKDLHQRALKRVIRKLEQQTNTTCKGTTGAHYCYEGQSHFHFGKHCVLSADATMPNHPAECDITISVHINEPNRIEYVVSVFQQVAEILSRHPNDEARLQWVWDTVAKKAAALVVDESESPVEQAPHCQTCGWVLGSNHPQCEECKRFICRPLPPINVFDPNYRP